MDIIELKYSAMNEAPMFSRCWEAESVKSAWDSQLYWRMWERLDHHIFILSFKIRSDE